MRPQQPFRYNGSPMPIPSQATRRTLSAQTLKAEEQAKAIKAMQLASAAADANYLKRGYDIYGQTIKFKFEL